ncbi:MAG: RidA family protein, partial [bacterium]|nr:RidA family protein [bacterium]
MLLACGANLRGEVLSYIGHGGPAGGSDAVIVRGASLVHTAQLLPVNELGQIVGEGWRDQVDKVFDNLATVLRGAGADLSEVVRLNVVVSRTDVVPELERAVKSRFSEQARPAVSLVQGALAHPKAVIAMDAVATTLEAGGGKVRLEGTNRLSVLPTGPRVYISGRAGDGGLEDATVETLEKLRSVLAFLRLDLSHVVQVKAFLKPISRAADCERKIIDFFGGKAPPLVFVEWRNPKAVEIEMVAAAHGGRAGDRLSI